MNFLSKRFYFVLLLILFCILLGSCGPSPEELAATSAAQTAAAATNTPIPSATPEPTISPPPTDTSIPAPTPIPPFRDDFTQLLEDGWEWRYEVEGGWNLDDRPGFLRVKIPLTAKQYLIRNAPEGNFQITTRILCKPNHNFQSAGLLIMHDDGHMLKFSRGYAYIPNTSCCIGNALYYENIDYDLGSHNAGYAINILPPTKTDEVDEAYLRLIRYGDTYTASYSNDGENWSIVGKHDVNWKPVYIGIQIYSDQTVSLLNADFDFFEMEVLP